jgi:membrane dipeptidase
MADICYHPGWLVNLGISIMYYRRCTRICLFIAVLLLTLSATAQDDARLLQQARDLAQTALIVDTHVDVPYRIHNHWADVTKATEDGDFDQPRARAGGLNAPFMSIYLPWETEIDGSANALANALIDQVEAIAARDPENFGIAYSSTDVRRLFKQGRIALPMGMENGAAVHGDLDQLRHFYQRGIRYITLAHARANHIADSSYDPVPLWQGLSPFGQQLVKAMNDIGMIVDISHVSDQAFYEALEISRAPLVASHSSVRHFTPGFERNMSDEMIQALAAKGGIIMINFGSSFLTAKANAWQQKFSAARDNLRSQLGSDDEDDPRVQAFADHYRSKLPFPFATVSDVADHIDHVVELVGIDHVGIGSDYDGVGDSLPTGLKDVSTYPNLVAELLRRGYSEKDIRKVLGENFMRVWEQIEAVAEH